MLCGNSESALVGTPFASNGRSLMSGSSDAEANAPKSDSREGREPGLPTAPKAMSAASSHSWIDKGGSCVSWIFWDQLLFSGPLQPRLRHPCEWMGGVRH